MTLAEVAQKTGQVIHDYGWWRTYCVGLKYRDGDQPMYFKLDDYEVVHGEINRSGERWYFFVPKTKITN